jgi:hypothetical protein
MSNYLDFDQDYVCRSSFQFFNDTPNASSIYKVLLFCLPVDRANFAIPSTFLIFGRHLMTAVTRQLPIQTFLAQSPQSRVRAGCPCEVTNASEHTYPNGAVRRVAEIALLDHTQRLIPLKEIHRDLESSHLPLHTSGSSNICLCRIGFNCQVNFIGGQMTTRYFSFDLKVPGDSTNQGVFSSDMMMNSGGSAPKQALYSAISFYHNNGRRIANPRNVTHGNRPNYTDINTPLNDSFILHTEQMLVAYLDRPQAAQMLRNRLITHIRGEFPNATSATVHAIGIHLHQNKTCCGPCEYSLIGLMHSTQQGFIANLITACTGRDERLALQIMNSPSNPAWFPMVTTVTATESDATHQALPKFTKTTQPVNKPPMRSIIDLAAPVTSQRIHTSILSPHAQANIPMTSSQYEGSIAISGSLQTKGSRGTITATSAQREDALDDLTAGVARLFS